MDLCHCPEPTVVTKDGGQTYCSACGLWYVYEEWVKDPRRNPPKTVKVGRNDPCPCRSGKKFKHCCMDIVKHSPQHENAAHTHGHSDCSCGSHT